MSWQVHTGDCLEVLPSLEPASVQTVVTSPPYWGLRDYGTDGQLGLEPTPEEYVANLVEVFREVRRVLRDDGTVWLNLGDSYAGAPVGSFNGGGFKDASAASGGRDLSGVETSGRMDKAKASGLKPKDLVGIPWRTAFALQADGWWLRSDIIWSKPNPMPESVTDRPTRAHEYIFLLTKSARYFYDADAIREEGKDWSSGGPGVGIEPTFHYGAENGGNEGLAGIAARYKDGTQAAGRNRRSVWEIATQPYSEAHFATFPPKLVEPCVLAGSPPKCCGECGAPWERLTESERSAKEALVERTRNVGGRTDGYTRTKSSGGLPPVERSTVGWKSTCYHADAVCSDCRGAGGVTVAGPDEFGNYDGEECETCGGSGLGGPDDSGSATVLDPFAGAGTTGVIATRHNRDFIGVELSEEYAEMARSRIRDDAPLFNGEEAYSSPVRQSTTDKQSEIGEQQTLSGGDRLSGFNERWEARDGS